MSEKLPGHMKQEYGIMSAFRAAKRRQVRVAIQGVKSLRYGCAYTPAYKFIEEAANALERVRRAISIKEGERAAHTKEGGS